jgi:hypothetical protein
MFLSVRGVVFINWLPSGGKFTSSYVCTEVLEPLAQILHHWAIIHSARPIVHFDNATPHRAAASESCFQRSRFRHAPQPPYSPDISPCDFFLFGDLKTRLTGQEFERMEELQQRVDGLLAEVAPDLMQRVYENWIERLNQVVHTDGDCV